MAKDTFDLKGFLIENKLTEGSRANDLRVRFIEERKESEPDYAYDIDMYAGELLEGEDFVNPEDLDEIENAGRYHPDPDSPDRPIRRKSDAEIEDQWPTAKIRQFYTDWMNAYNKHNRLVSSGQKEGKYINDVEELVFKKIRREFGERVPIHRILADRIEARNADRKAASARVTRNSPGGSGATYRDTDTYTGSAVRDEVAPTVLGRKQKGAWKSEKYDRFGNRITSTDLSEILTMDEVDFNSIANQAASNLRADDDAEINAPAPTDSDSMLNTLSSERPEDFGEYDEESIRRSYTDLKKKGYNDDRIMRLLAQAYGAPEETIRAMFRDVFMNKRYNAVQVDDPQDAPRMTLSKKKSAMSAAELAAQRDAAASGDFDDSDLDQDDTVRPGETDDDEESPEVDNTPVDKNSPDYLEINVPSNFEGTMSEREMQNYLHNFKRPEKATGFLQRAINTAQVEAANAGSGKLYMYLCSDGYYHTFSSSHGIGEEVNYKRGSASYKAKTKKFMFTIDCNGAQAPGRKGSALQKSQTTSTSNVAPEDDNPVQLTRDEINKYVHSKHWKEMPLKDKIQSEFWKYSDEYKTMMGDDEPVDSDFAGKFADDGEDPIDWTDPEDREWALNWATK